MKIALIWPHGFDTLYVVPLSLGYLKSNASSEHEFKIIDCSLRNILANSAELRKELGDFKPDVVGVSCWSPTYHEALKILKLAKSLNPKTVTVMGGAHPSSYSDAAMRESDVDHVFRGEAELSFQVFLEEIQKSSPDFKKVYGLVWRKENGSLVKNELEREPDLDKIKIPDYKAIAMGQYIESGYRFNTKEKMNAPIWVTRGCPYRCGFCSAPFQNGRAIRAHSVPYMLDWIKVLHEDLGIKLFNIIDDNFTFDMKYAKEFCLAMIELKLPGLGFSTPNGIRLQRTDPELLRLMKKSGWEYIVVAPESGSVRTLLRMKKDLKPESVPPKVREIKEAGLRVHGFFILGYPGDEPQDIMDTRKLIRECKFNFFFINNFQPLPGTPIYDELVAAKEISDGLLPKNYSSGERVYTPAGLVNFNFPKFILKEYLYLAMSNPLNIPYIIRFMSPKMATKKILQNLWNMLMPNRRRLVFFKSAE